MLEKFKFHIFGEADLEKSEKEGKRYIRGYASTPSDDRQGESLVQKGLDISHFVKFGFLNWDHDNKVLLGYPTENTHINDRGLWVEGVLLKGVELADHIWNVAVSLQKSSAPRKLGFSVEGKVLERDSENPKRILKAQIFNCAITPNPVNTEATWEAVVKSFSPEADTTIVKALESGHQDPPQNGGSSLRRESLEGAIKTLAKNIDNTDEWDRYRGYMMANGGQVTPAEALVYLQLYKGLSKQEALQIVNSF